MAYFYQEQYPQELALHQRYAQSPILLELVWTHSCILADICQQLLNAQLFDTRSVPPALVMQACLLHDLGVYLCDGFEWIPGQPITGRPYIQHMIVGAWILFKEGYPPPVVQVAYAHKATGITAADVTKFGMQIPVQDYPVPTLIQQLICYASKHHSKAPRFRQPEEIVQSLEKYGPEKTTQFAAWYEFFGPVKMGPLEEKYGQWQSCMVSQLETLRADTSHLMV